MFRSATLKLTAWYAGLLMIITILFSVAFYQLSLSEINTRLAHFKGVVQTEQNTTLPQENQPRISIDSTGVIKNKEDQAAAAALFSRLLDVNILVLIAGTIASYLLARHTLKPVEDAHLRQARFVSDASHELRTPLAVMKSELEVGLRDPTLSKKELSGLLLSTLEEVNRLEKMSNMLLAMSRLETQSLPTQEIDLKLTAAEAMYRFKPSKDRLHLTGKNVTIMANETSLMELVSILIENALKYSPADSPVELHVDTEGKRAVLHISNEGEGISEEALDHIFDRFYRVDSSRTSSTEQKGFGLGLAIAQQIAELHHGEITATSAPKERTTFSYYQERAA